MSNDQFAEMFMIDGCFVVGVCLRFGPIRAASDTVEVPGDYAFLWRDLMLLENQIPFFIVNKLYNKIAKLWYKDDYHDFVSLVLKILGINLPPKRYPKEEEVLHLLHLLHLSLDPCLIPDICRWRLYRLLGMSDACTVDKSRDPVLISCAKELYEARIKFQKINIPKEYSKRFPFKDFFQTWDA